jgi:hypothetical protein
LTVLHDECPLFREKVVTFDVDRTGDDVIRRQVRD